MINPLRYRSVKEQLDFEQLDAPAQCWQCRQESISTPAFFLCHECGKADAVRPYCEPCFLDHHVTKRKKGKEGHKPHPIVRGDPVKVQRLSAGDATTFAKTHDWVALDYVLTTIGSDNVLESTYSTKRPLVFQSGCSGPCVHVQLLGCNDIAAADILGSRDPYCAVYWGNNLVGATTTKYMTLNPTWRNQTFVLPLNKDLLDALDDDRPAELFRPGVPLPKLRVKVYQGLSPKKFLAQVSLNDADLLRILRCARRDQGDKEEIISFKLTPRQSQGKLGVRATIRGLKLFVHIVQAENLPKADLFSLSDSYCEIFWNSKRVGKTARVDDSLDPVWNLEIFTINMGAAGPNSLEQSTLRIVCLYFDRFGSDGVLGQIKLQGWQIRELAGNGRADEIISLEEKGLLSETSMERIHHFIQAFQEHELQGDPGKLIVGVPLDLAMEAAHEVDSTDEAEAVVVLPEPSKTEIWDKKKEDMERKQERKPKAKAKTQMEVDRPSEAISNGEQKRFKGDNARTRGPKGERENAVERDGTRKITQAENLKEGRELERARARVERIQFTVDQERGLGVPLPSGQYPAQREKVTAIAVKTASGAESKLEGTDTSEIAWRDEREGNPSRTNYGELRRAAVDEARNPSRKPSLLALDASSVWGLEGDGSNVDVTISVVQKRGPQRETQDGLDNEVGSVRVSEEVKSEDKNPLQGERCELVEPLESRSEKRIPLSLQAKSIAATKPVAGAGPEEGRSKVEGEKATEDRAFNWDREPREDIVVCFRNARVHRFEEGRGVLLKYVDDNSSVWVAPKFIPRLRVRDEAPANRKVSQHLKNQWHKLFHLRSRTLKVKHGLKIFLEVAMTGSRMQWYQLELTEDQSVSKMVHGSVDLRFLYHTKGTVLRGLDIAVSGMSLGERARIEVRPDYGFGEIYAAKKVPPYTTMVFVAQLIAIGHRNARWLLARRAVGEVLLRLRSFTSYLAWCSTVFSGRFGGLLSSWERNGLRGQGRRDDEEKVGEDCILRRASRK